METNTKTKDSKKMADVTAPPQAVQVIKGSERERGAPVQPLCSVAVEGATSGRTPVDVTQVSGNCSPGTILDTQDDTIMGLNLTQPGLPAEVGGSWLADSRTAKSRFSSGHTINCSFVKAQPHFVLYPTPWQETVSQWPGPWVLLQ